MQTLYDRQRLVRFGRGETILAFCHHGKKIIEDYEQILDACAICQNPGRRAHSVHAKTHYNRVLKKEFSSIRESEKFAKRHGLEPVGDSSLRDVSRSLWPEHPLTQGAE